MDHHSTGIREFDFIYRFRLPAVSKATSVWLPHARTDEFQRASLIDIDSPVPHTSSEDVREGNRIIYFHFAPDDNHRDVSLRFRVERHARHSPRPTDSDYGEDIANSPLARFLRPDTRVPTDGYIADTANSFASLHDAPRTRARKIFDYLLETLEYDSRGCTPDRVDELGDLHMACDLQRGTCTEFHGLFVAYARALGLPARFTFGFNVPRNKTHGPIAGYHCWAEVYLPEVQWFPVDVSEAYKRSTEEERDFYFGNLDENRVHFSTGRDLDLEPQQQGGPVDKLIFPVAQNDDGDVDTYPAFSFVDRTPDSDDA